MSQGHARAAHTLGEILLDTRTTEEKVKGAAKSAPFWVIAIMAHLILVFVFGMVVLRQETVKDEVEAMTSELAADVPDLKLDEKPEAPPEEIERSTIPVDEGPTIAREDVFVNATDDVVNPDAQPRTQPGESPKAIPTARAST